MVCNDLNYFNEETLCVKAQFTRLPARCVCNKTAKTFIPPFGSLESFIPFRVIHNVRKMSHEMNSLTKVN